MVKQFLICLCLGLVLFSCSTTEQATQEPVADTSEESKTEQQEQPEPTVDFSTMLEPPQNWHHLDEQQTQFRGISSQRAYENILNNKTPEKEVVVAVIDGGIDTEHQDLTNNIWTNTDEIPGNNKDDDGNGYVDDVHGWSFIGGADGNNVNHDTFELTRIYRDLKNQFANADTTSFTQKERQAYNYYRTIQSDYEKKIKDLDRQYSNIRSLEQSMNRADNILISHFGSTSYSFEQIQQLQPTNQQLNFAKNVMSYVMENDIDSTLIADQKEQIYEFAKYGYNPDFNPRDIVGDNYADKTERYYGNNDVAGPDPSHGTHVAGIIAAVRNNEIGIDGVASNTKIMAIRAVPNGDERDKDVANAIRYAVDNGADIINMSFGKGYSPHREIVSQAILHADTSGVLMIHGAGNEAQNTDTNPSYPTDSYESILSDSTASLWISVGASSWKPNKEFVANFSNYGNASVDVFAPGVDIYSTMPDNQYKFQDGTSMASPVVAGMAALVMAYYPELSPRQVHQLILEQTTGYPNQQVLRPHDGNPQEAEEVPFAELSASDGLVNLYKVLRAAEKLIQ